MCGLKYYLRRKIMRITKSLLKDPHTLGLLQDKLSIPLWLRFVSHYRNCREHFSIHTFSEAYNLSCNDVLLLSNLMEMSIRLDYSPPKNNKPMLKHLSGRYTLFNKRVSEDLRMGFFLPLLEFTNVDSFCFLCFLISDLVFHSDHLSLNPINNLSYFFLNIIDEESYDLWYNYLLNINFSYLKVPSYKDFVTCFQLPKKN